MYQIQACRNVYHTAFFEEPLSAVERYRLRLKDEDVDVCTETSHYMVLELVEAIFEWIEIQDLKQRQDVFMITGKIMDGGTDRACHDSEVVGDSFAKKDGHAKHKFIARVEVDYRLPRDGRSCDSLAQYRSINQFFQSKPQPYHSWLEDTPGVSMDAASVNFAEHSGMVALMQARGGLQIVGERGKAHQLELAAGESWRSVDYFVETWTPITNKSISHIGGSPKRQFSIRAFGEYCDDAVRQIPSLHGVRWQASLQKSAAHTIKDYRPLAMHFHYHGKSHASQANLGAHMKKMFYNTPVINFSDMQFGRRFEGQGTHTATVVSIEDDENLEHATIKVHFPLAFLHFSFAFVSSHPDFGCPL